MLLERDKTVTAAELRVIVLDICGGMLAVSRAITECQTGHSKEMYEALGELNNRVQSLLNKVK